MTTTLYDAREEMRVMFYTQWLAATPDIVGYVPEVFFNSVGVPESPDNSKFWARFSTQNVNTPQESISTCVSENGKRRYNNTGFVIVQLFGPKNADDAASVIVMLADVIAKAYRGKHSDGGIWFNNVRVNDGLSPEKDLIRCNVIADYSFDEIN